MPSVSWADVAKIRSWRLGREGITLWRLEEDIWVLIVGVMRVAMRSRTLAFLCVDVSDVPLSCGCSVVELPGVFV